MGRGPYNSRQTRTLRASEKTMGTAAAILLRKSYLCAGKSSMDGEVTKPLLVSPNIYMNSLYVSLFNRRSAGDQTSGDESDGGNEYAKGRSWKI